MVLKSDDSNVKGTVIQIVNRLEDHKMWRKKPESITYRDIAHVSVII